jgi:hypothetical protein
MAPMSYRDNSFAQSHFFTLSPSSTMRRMASAPLVFTALLEEPRVAAKCYDSHFMFGSRSTAYRSRRPRESVA